MSDSLMVRIENLHAGYPGKEILRAVSCSFGAGTFTGIIGPNGSGKTTLLRAISRVLPSRGTLELEGQDIRNYSPAELGTRLGFVPQDEARPFSFTVLQVVLMARYARTSRFASLVPEDYDRCHRVLEETGIAHLAGRSIRTLSGGEWQRVLIARALAQDTPVILLDEPTSHLDLAHQVQILSLMRDLAASGKTIIGVFHDLNLAAMYCDRLIMIKDGALVAEGMPAEVLTSAKIRDVYGAEVMISRHPATGRIWLVPVRAEGGQGLCCRPHHVLVISGGGSGTGLLQFLAGRDFSISAGILATTDTDYLTATTLELPVIPVLPFSGIPAHALEKLKGWLRTADSVVLSVHPVGAGNLPVLLALRDCDPARLIIHLPEDRTFQSCDFAKGSAAEVYTALHAAGARCCTTSEEVLCQLLEASQDSHDSLEG
ncbi:MAG: ABC transporter ATP-binding protein, partial [Methanomicrobiales archaeon]|nr:ABC transporter ATP-binding protein [Methanomicrobiales archaeon]